MTCEAVIISHYPCLILWMTIECSNQLIVQKPVAVVYDN